MERKIGETFEYGGKTLQVKEAEQHACKGCFFENKCNKAIVNPVAGNCFFNARTDKKEVVFVEVAYTSDEEPRKQDEQKLNLCEKLKYCPEGTQFWSPMLGDVKLYDINQEAKMVAVELESGDTWNINADGTISIDEVTSPEVMLYPSKEQRDWTKVKYEPKKELPRTWEEFCEQNEIREWECFIDDCCDLKELPKEGGAREKKRDRNLLPSREAAEAHLALMQLHQLRDVWREGWVPDWKDGGKNKYVIANDKGESRIWDYQTIIRFLAFQDKKRAEEFVKCFRDLIEKAGDLI